MKAVIAILVMFVAVMLLFSLVLPIRDAVRAPYGWRAQLQSVDETATISPPADR